MKDREESDCDSRAVSFAVISVQVSLEMDQPVSGLTIGVVITLVALGISRCGVIYSAPAVSLLARVSGVVFPGK